MNERRILVWFSCGAASAVAAKFASSVYPDCELLYCDTLSSEHPDNARFMKDVEEWVGKPVKILSSPDYTDIYDVFRKTKWLVGPKGARCTTELKKKVRQNYQRDGDLHIFGLTADEKNRVRSFEKHNMDIEFEWLLVDRRITKADCYKIIQNAGIALPEMYLLGYNNNNCIGCVKGCKGYWNKIRVDFPDVFEKMAKMEREIGAAICKSYEKGVRSATYLDELDPEDGQGIPIPDIECGLLCMSDPEAELK